MEKYNLMSGSMVLTLIYSICAVLFIFYSVQPKDDRKQYADGLTMFCIVCSVNTIALILNHVDISGDPFKGAIIIIDIIMTIGTFISAIYLSKKGWRTEHDNNALAILSFILFAINCYIITTF